MKMTFDGYAKATINTYRDVLCYNKLQIIDRFTQQHKWKWTIGTIYEWYYEYL